MNVSNVQPGSADYTMVAITLVSLSVSVARLRGAHPDQYALLIYDPGTEMWVEVERPSVPAAHPHYPYGWGVYAD